jgi:peptidoglycan/xylan/chitin deacetylase (PgdA/CDA1 family)
MKPLLMGCAAATFLCSLTARAEETPIRIANFRGDRAGALSYTFDDGLREQITIARPMLDEQGFHATFFIIAGLVANTTAEAEAKKPGDWGGVTWDELRSVSAAGHEIGNHSFSHPGLPKLDPAKLPHEVIDSQEKIRGEIGIAPVTFCYPYNAADDTVRALVKEHHFFTRDFQSGFGKNNPTADSINRWADGLVAQKKWGVTMIHGINVGFDALPQDSLKAHLAYVKTREADLWVDTFANVSRYLQLRDSAKLEILKQEPHRLFFKLTAPETPATANTALTLVVTIPDAKAAPAVQQENGKKLPIQSGTNGSIRFDCVPGNQRVAVTW